jgi:transposase
MATQRRFGQELNQNARRGPNTTVSQREQIIGILRGGYTIAEVANAYGRTDRAIRDLRKKYTQTGSVQDKPRSGQPPMLST